MAQKQDGSQIVNFNMTPEDLERLDAVAEKEGYYNRADAIRTLIRLRFESLFGVVKKTSLRQAPSESSSCSSATEA